MEEGVLYEFVGGPIHGETRLVPGPYNHWLVLEPASEHWNAPIKLLAHYELSQCQDGVWRFVFLNHKS